MKRNIIITLVVVAVLTGLFTWQIMYGHADSIYGVWDLGKEVDIELRDDNSFAFYTKVGQLDQKSLTGNYSFDEAKNQIHFQTLDDVIFSWSDVSVLDNKLSFTQNGVSQTYSRVGGMAERETAEATGEPVIAVFPFNKQLAEKLSAGFDLPAYWDGLNGFRNSHEGFEEATLYEHAEGDASYPFITVDHWRSVEAYASFAAVFNTDAMKKASFITSENGPGVYRVVDQLGSIPSTGEQVFALVFVDVPDDLIETYMSQWKILSDFMANQAGFQGAELYRLPEDSDNHYEYFIRAAWISGDGFQEARKSEFYQAIVANQTYESRSALYRIASEDK